MGSEGLGREVAAQGARQPASALGHLMQIRVLRLPRLPKTRFMARPVPGKTQPVQLHAIAFKVQRGGRLLGMTTQQPHGGKAKTLAGSGQGMQMVGMGTPQADQPVCPCLMGGAQMLGELEPLVAADQRVDQVQAQHRHFHPGLVQPVQMQALQGCMGVPVDQGQHGWGSIEKQQVYRSPSIFMFRTANKLTPAAASC